MISLYFFPALFSSQTSKRSWHLENELQKGVFSILHVGWLHETLWKWWWSPWGWPLFSLRDRRSLLDSLRRFLVLDRGAVTCENGTTEQCYQLFQKDWIAKMCWYLPFNIWKLQLLLWYIVRIQYLELRTLNWNQQTWMPDPGQNKAFKFSSAFRKSNNSSLLIIRDMCAW